MEKSNQFTKHFLSKSDSELHSILTSEHHVYEAKQAATWELERRLQTSAIELKELEPKLELPRYKMPERKKKEAKWKIIFFGMMMIGIGIYFNYDTLLVTESSLIPIKGSVQYSKTYIKRVSSRNRYGGMHYSNKATLELKLFEHSATFRMFENIGQSRFHQSYNELTRRLTKRTPVTVWVSEDKMRYNPDFFKLDIRGNTVVDMNYTTSTSRFGFFFMLIFGIIIIYLGTRTDWMEKVIRFFKG